MKKLVVLFTGILLLAGCSGGGGGSDGGSDGGFYAGIWDFSGVKVLDDCGSSAPVAGGERLTVNQDGSLVVLNSGALTLSGTTHNDDGFTVAGESITSGGCPATYAYDFKNASDGEADVGLALTVRCGGVRCTAAYGGKATKAGTRDLDLGESPELDAEQATEAMAAVAE